jgi:putative nucleotidyltransferase with HDIG domain
MIDHAARSQLYEELLRRLVAALRGAQLYSPAHPLAVRTSDALLDVLREVHAGHPSIAIGLVGHEVVVGDVPIPRAAETMAELIKRLQARGIERVTFDRGVEAHEITAFLQAAGSAAPARPAGPEAGTEPEAIALPHVRAGRLRLDNRDGESAPASATLKRLYDDAVACAERVWESASTEGQPDLPSARYTIDGLADAVTHRRTALLALTALRQYDNYTFTHMVNVSILTMGQARSLGIEGRLLRELGLAGLMHDIGKVRTPIEILAKSEKLTEAEFAIMKRHVVDGAELLRRTPEIPTVAPVVALEHHLRIDGKGYPDVRRPSLNLATMLCGIADVYDAMRSKRKYQQAYPTDRILAVLRGNDGHQFDQDLVRRFVQLIGIYPPGTLVRLNNAEVAIVVQPYPPDPHRPRVRVLFGPDGDRLASPRPRDLWVAQDDSEAVLNVDCPLDPAEYDVDPLACL